jgi:hypothetical protein
LTTTPHAPTRPATAFAERRDGRPGFGGAALTGRTFLRLADGIPLDEWKRIGQQIHVVSESSIWWLGDWLIYGQRKYPDRYKRAIAETALDYQTLRNYAWVAGRFTASRRRAALSFQHHAEVAAMPESDQNTWLDKAERFSWSRNQLRSHIRGARSSPDPSEPAEVVQVQLQISSHQISRWRDAAERAEQDLVVWMTDVLDQAAIQRAADAGQIRVAV